ncbi:related to calponin [Lecanosticta acicola]|uniref:Related to calponin n=1 Tax=Lecanosticta acicola TaxID=111012 RepID=A0AAI9EC32_9PEZI|nr:related to calponin [Lecanosticta acicola]
MASVSSLDQDVRNLRLSRYTPQAANEARAWIERTLGQSLPNGDLLDALKDGVALCKLANLAIASQHAAIKFKASPMPFIQMENISHFLRACEMPPLNMPAHDRFLTVDLFEQKDPAQVLQCLGAFSRQANKINPSRFSTTIGGKKNGAAMSPATTGGNAGFSNGGSFRRPASPTKPSAAVPASSTRAMSPALTGGSTGSQSSAKSPSGPVSSWSKRSDEGITSPAWNIHQYGYMGGASQGNQGISFGARRQITSQAPSVPSLAGKEKLRREKEAEVERQRQQQTEEQERRRRAAEEEEERARMEEERQWEEETKRQREQERRRLDDQKREWEEQEHRWKEEEEARRKEDAALRATMSKKAPEKPRVPSSSILRGQTLAEYQKEQAALSRSASSAAESAETPEQKRVRELEQQLEEARERERQYQAEREDRLRKEQKDGSRPGTADAARPQSAHESDVSWAGDEREYLRQQWQSSRETPSSRPGTQQRPLPTQPQTAPTLPQRALPEHTAQEPLKESKPPTLPSRSQPSSSPFGTRPLSTPSKDSEPFEPEQRKSNRTDQFLAANAPPSNPGPRISSAQEAGDTSLEQSQLRDSRIASQQKTKAGGWASKSLLEREMERERERQKEWEANQQAVQSAPRDSTQGTGEGQAWDVNQYGYMGGDSMNRGSSVGSGINIGGRRQIIGPRPQK